MSWGVGPLRSWRRRSTAAGVYGDHVSYTSSDQDRNHNREQTREIAALVALMVGLGRCALGIGGGLAATCGESAAGDRVLAEGVDEGITTGGVSPSVGVVDADVDACEDDGDAEGCG